MFLVVHASVGAVLGEQFDSPFVSFIAGFFSHFVLDIIPHGDEVIGRTFGKTKSTHWLAALALIDGLTAIALLTVFWMVGLIQNPIGAFVGGVAAMMPDVLSGITIVSKNKFLPDFDKLHEKNHQLLGLEAKVWVGGLVQAIVLVTVWTVPLLLLN